MIIICPSCEKKFQIEDKLIPKEGRLLQCGSCSNEWFFKKESQDVKKSFFKYSDFHLPKDAKDTDINKS